ncbi:hypothetical protein [uncultured Aquimarina sp.]|uniref:hypothetical protein n=1 Tax=uncultured Aquimarina sp. TaxID=575652 RepID=UPI002614BB80|nr:hypothetical protein [uncultured Aquimarina sp.]
MRRFFITKIAMLLSIITFGQRGNTSLENNKFKFRSIQSGFGVYHTKPKNNDLYDHSGITVNSLISMSYKKNIFSFRLESGTELVIINFGGDPELQGFYGANLLYGRELELTRWFKIEGNVGIGLYHHKIIAKRGAVDQKNVLGMSMNTKLLFYPAKRFAFGLSPFVNFNSINTTYSGNVVFQYKFN